MFVLDSVTLLDILTEHRAAARAHRNGPIKYWIKGIPAPLNFPENNTFPSGRSAEIFCVVTVLWSEIHYNNIVNIYILPYTKMKTRFERYNNMLQALFIIM